MTKALFDLYILGRKQSIKIICWCENWPLYTEGNERLKKEAARSRLVSGSFNKQGNLLTRLALVSWKTNRSQHPPARILSLHRDLNRLQSRILSTWSQEHITRSRLSSWKWFPLWEWWAECIFQGQGRGWGVSDCPDPALGSTGSYALSMASSDISARKDARKDSLGQKPLNLLSRMPGQPKQVDIQAYIGPGSRKHLGTTPGLELTSLPKGTRRVETWRESRQRTKKSKAGYGATCGSRSMCLRTAGALQTSCIPILLDPHWYN